MSTFTIYFLKIIPAKASSTAVMDVENSLADKSFTFKVFYYSLETDVMSQQQVNLRALC